MGFITCTSLGLAYDRPISLGALIGLRKSAQDLPSSINMTGDSTVKSA